MINWYRRQCRIATSVATSSLNWSGKCCNFAFAKNFLLYFGFVCLEVQLLRADNLSPAKLTPKVIEAGSLVPATGSHLKIDCHPIPANVSVWDKEPVSRLKVEVRNASSSKSSCSTCVKPQPLTPSCSKRSLNSRGWKVLKSALRQKGAWLSQRLETLAELPAKLDAKAMTAMHVPK